MNIWYIYLYMFNMFFFLASVLLHTCGCVPSQPCGSCSGCSGLCSSRSESLGSRPSDLAYVCERACSSASRNHNVPSSPLQNHSVTISFNSVCQCNTYDIANVDLDQEAYLLRCPRGRDGLSPSCLWPPPLCCCQWQRRECFPCWENGRDDNIKTVFGRGGWRWVACSGWSSEWCSADVLFVVASLVSSYLSSSIFLLLAFLITCVSNHTVNTFLLSGVTQGHGQREIYWHAYGVLTAR